MDIVKAIRNGAEPIETRLSPALAKCTKQPEPRLPGGPYNSASQSEAEVNFFIAAIAALLLPAAFCLAAWGCLTLLRRMRRKSHELRALPVRRRMTISARARVTEPESAGRHLPDYTYDSGISRGFPEVWEEDLLLRRN